MSTLKKKDTFAGIQTEKGLVKQRAIGAVVIQGPLRMADIKGHNGCRISGRGKPGPLCNWQ